MSEDNGSRSGPGSGFLAADEPHPMAGRAFSYCAGVLATPVGRVLFEGMAASAEGGDRTGEVCFETARRIMEGESVSDRYVLGLAWFMQSVIAKAAEKAQQQG